MLNEKIVEVQVLVTLLLIKIVKIVKIVKMEQHVLFTLFFVAIALNVRYGLKLLLKLKLHAKPFLLIAKQL